MVAIKQKILISSLQWKQQPDLHMFQTITHQMQVKCSDGEEKLFIKEKHFLLSVD